MPRDVTKRTALTIQVLCWRRAKRYLPSQGPEGSNWQCHVKAKESCTGSVREGEGSQVRGWENLQLYYIPFLLPDPCGLGEALPSKWSHGGGSLLEQVRRNSLRWTAPKKRDQTSLGNRCGLCFQMKEFHWDLLGSGQFNKIWCCSSLFFFLYFSVQQ